MAKAHTIDGHDVYIERLDTLSLVRELPSVAGSLLPVIIELASQAGEDPEIEISQVLPAFEALGDGFDALVERLLATTAVRVGNELTELTSRAAINEVFGGRLAFLFKVLFKAVEVHYGDFLSGGGASSAAQSDS